LISVNPLHAILWTFRRNPRDVINLYNSLSPVMQLATRGNMLNFGYWNGVDEPIAAQKSLCSLVAQIAELSSANRLVDVGSGLGAPAIQWKETHAADIICININYKQLLFALRSEEKHNDISIVNATSTMLPLSDGSVDRVIALESAQHFKPLEQFLSEARRVLRNDGLLVMALPVMSVRHGYLTTAAKLGILSFTWSSEHYGLDYVKSAVNGGGFVIQDVVHMGHQVYEPLADYYIKNRQVLRENILKEYSSFVEEVLYKSLIKMKNASAKEIIDYVIIKAS
jgi:ubiquinone/menaquinone biosynthesis C-methylase UbiE